jgi:transposase
VGDLFMSLIHTCQLSGVNPLEYLTWLLKNIGQIPNDPFAYLPWKYQPG